MRGREPSVTTIFRVSEGGSYTATHLGKELSVNNGCLDKYAGYNWYLWSDDYEEIMHRDNRYQ